VSSVPHPEVMLVTRVARVWLLQLPTLHMPFNQVSTVGMMDEPEPVRNSPESPEALMHLASGLAAMVTKAVWHWVEMLAAWTPLAIKAEKRTNLEENMMIGLKVGFNR